MARSMTQASDMTNVKPFTQGRAYRPDCKRTGDSDRVDARAGAALQDLPCSHGFQGSRFLPASPWPAKCAKVLDSHRLSEPPTRQRRVQLQRKQAHCADRCPLQQQKQVRHALTKRAQNIRRDGRTLHAAQQHCAGSYSASSSFYDAYEDEYG